MATNRDSQEYKNFNRVMTDLLKVPHGETKAKLDATRGQKAAVGNLHFAP